MIALPKGLHWTKLASRRLEALPGRWARSDDEIRITTIQTVGRARALPNGGLCSITVLGSVLGIVTDCFDEQLNCDTVAEPMTTRPPQRLYLVVDLPSRIPRGNKALFNVHFMRRQLDYNHVCSQ